MGKDRESTLRVLIALGSLVAQTSAGSITGFDPVNAVSSGGISITISGLDFGTTSYTPTVDLGQFTACATTSWTSSTTVGCYPDSPVPQWGTGGNIKPYFRGSSTYTSTTDYFTFDAPVVSFALQHTGISSNGPATGASSVTITGLNFASIDKTATVRIRAVCRTSSWTSSTTLSCQNYQVTSTDTSYAESVTVTGQAGTFASGLFSFDAPSLTFSSWNTPTSGGATLTLDGTNFAPVDYTPTAHIYNTVCQTTLWITSTNIKCVSPAIAFYWKVPAAITVSAIVGTRSTGISYDTPAVTYNHPGNAPALVPDQYSAYHAYVTIFGLNFGPIDATASASIDNDATANGWQFNMCQTTSWTTGTNVVCSPSKYGYSGQRSVAVGGLGSSGARAGGGFTYDAPIITTSNIYNGGASGGNTVTIAGLNFGYTNTTPESYVGVSSCPTTSWTSGTTVKCGEQTSAITDPSQAITRIGVGTNSVSFHREKTSIQWTDRKSVV